MDLNIVQLYKGIVDRQKAKTKAFDKLLQSCYKLIQNASNHEHTRCLFRVPDFVLGVPPYNLEEAIGHMTTRLESGGFMVNYYFPNVLMISWHLNDLEKRERLTGKKFTGVEGKKHGDDLKLLEPSKRVQLNRSIVARRPISKFSLSLAAP
jgi:hypothetical protein